MDLKEFLEKNKILGRIAFICSVLLFLYLMIFFNLYKTTKEINFNIFSSPAIGKLFIAFAILIPVAALIEYIFKKKK